MNKYGKYILIPIFAAITGTIFLNEGNGIKQTEAIASLYSYTVSSYNAYAVGTGAVVNISSWPIGSRYMNYYRPNTVQVNGTNYWTEYQGTGEYDNVAYWLRGTNYINYYAINNGVATNYMGPPRYGKHAVGTMPYFSMIHDHILDSLRDLVLVDAEPINDIRVYWLDGDVDEDSVMAYADAYPYLDRTDTNNIYFGQYITKTYSVTSPSNAWSDVMTTSTRTPTPSVHTYTQLLHPTNTPIASTYYDNINKTNTAYSGYGNFWNRYGLGTNLASFSCEKYIESNGVTVLNEAYVAGQGYTATTTALTYSDATYATPQAFNVKAGVGVNGASVYRIGNGSISTVVGIADTYSSLVTGPYNSFFHCYGSLTSFGSPATTFIVGTSTTLYLDIGFGNTKTVTLSYSGDVSGPASVSWSESVSPYQGVITITCPVNGAGVITCNSDVSGIQTVSRFAVVNPNTSDVVVDSYTATATDGTTHTFNVSLSSPPPQPPIQVWYDKRFLTNNYVQARKCIDKLKTTIAFVPLSEAVLLQPAQKLLFSTTATSNSSALAMLDLIDRTAYATAAVDSVQSLLGRCKYDAYYRYRTYTYPSHPSDNTNSTYSYLSSYAETCYYPQLQLPYPSHHSSTSGVIDKVTVYVVAKGNVPALIPDPAIGIADATNYSFTVSATGYNMQDQDSNTLSLVTTLSKHAISDLSYPTFKSLELVDCEAITSYRLSLVGSYDNPTTDPVFSLGSTLYPESLASTRLQQTQHIETASGAIHDIEWDYYNVDQNITLLGFVVVVDWDFDVIPTPYSPQYTLPQPNTNWKTNYYKLNSTGDVINLP